VGTSIFATASKASYYWVSLVAGSISVLNAVMLALQTHLKYAERSEKHLQAAQQYGALRRSLEQNAAAASTPVELQGVLSEIGPKWNEIDRVAPPVPQRLNKRVVREVVGK
jgi:hypothetical protein